MTSRRFTPNAGTCTTSSVVLHLCEHRNRITRTEDAAVQLPYGRPGSLKSTPSRVQITGTTVVLRATICSQRPRSSRSRGFPAPQVTRGELAIGENHAGPQGPPSPEQVPAGKVPLAEYAVFTPDCQQRAVNSKKFPLPVLKFHRSRDVIVLAVGVVIATLGATHLVTRHQHGVPLASRRWVRKSRIRRRRSSTICASSVSPSIPGSMLGCGCCRRGCLHRWPRCASPDG